jgi:hypothetical protein
VSVDDVLSSAFAEQLAAWAPEAAFGQRYLESFRAMLKRVCEVETPGQAARRR